MSGQWPKRATWDEALRVADLLAPDNAEFRKECEAAAESADADSWPATTVVLLGRKAGFVGIVDWKETGQDVFFEVSNQLEHHGQARISEGAEAEMMASAVVPEGQEEASLWELRPQLQAYLGDFERALVLHDIGEDTMYFSIVTPEVRTELTQMELGEVVFR